MRESLYTQLTIWVDTILSHIDTRTILPRYEDSCTLYRFEQYWQHKHPSNIHTLSRLENVKILIIDTQMYIIKEKDKII